MKTGKRPTIVLVIAVLLLAAGGLQALADWTTPEVRPAASVPANTVYVTIQPNAAGSTWIATVSWNQINKMVSGTYGTSNNGFDLEDAITGGTLLNPRIRFSDRQGDIFNDASNYTWLQVPSYRPTWQNVGNFLPFGAATYNNDSIASGWGNMVLLAAAGMTTDGGGIYLDQDGGAGDDAQDDFALIVPYFQGTATDYNTYTVEGTLFGNQSFNTVFTDLVSSTTAPNVDASVTTLDLTVINDATYNPIVIAPPPPPTLCADLQVDVQAAVCDALVGQTGIAADTFLAAIDAAYADAVAASGSPIDVTEEECLALIQSELGL